jgi:hypothetical protein
MLVQIFRFVQSQYHTLPFDSPESMIRDLRLGILAAIAAVLPGALLFVLGAPGAVAVIVTAGMATGTIVALGSSFDDAERWAAQSADAIERGRLEALADVRVAQPKEIVSGGRTAPWYDRSGRDGFARLDFVLVDGPPAWKGDRLARSLALYELKRHLAYEAVLVLDDAIRDGEVEIANQWLRDIPDLHFRTVRIGRGLFVVCL